MTVKELAGILSGREYGGEIYPLEERNAQAAGLVVVYGYSDDNVEFRGAIDDEIGAYEETTIYINKSGILYAPTSECDMDECPYLNQAVKEARSIRAVWHDEGNPCWTFETDIPHETFDICEDGELFCVGIVFALDDIQAKTPNNDPLTLDELREMDGMPVFVTKNGESIGYALIYSPCSIVYITCATGSKRDFSERVPGPQNRPRPSEKGTGRLPVDDCGGLYRTGA
ncbi:hypothetical protein D1159_03710 [Pseudoflavonifractor sp. 524-17]|uniref:hypothetical protein n=1 Tax=Pseudoflavonifractor sp. 524-17 TaxID=2304577 RepID=UPI001D66839A|nr:hypothetical protein [Pseudoflavonifractor sp. 524-17]NCE63706.1 hypothetical protein [Pseudoflavonifractor sp. 524-17]